MGDVAPPDFCHVMLGLPPQTTDPDHYQLLGLPQFEAHPEAIRAAAAAQISKLLRWQSSEHHQAADRLFDAVAHARDLLLDPPRKTEYDRRLRQQLGLPAPTAPRTPRTTPAAAQPGPPRTRPPSTRPSATPPVEIPRVPERPAPPAPAAFDLTAFVPPRELLDLVPEAIAREQVILPVRADGPGIVIATHRPDDLNLLEMLRFIFNREIQLIPSSEEDLRRAIDRLYPRPPATAPDAPPNTAGPSGSLFSRARGLFESSKQAWQNAVEGGQRLLDRFDQPAPQPLEVDERVDENDDEGEDEAPRSPLEQPAGAGLLISGGPGTKRRNEASGAGEGPAVPAPAIPQPRFCPHCGVRLLPKDTSCNFCMRQRSIGPWTVLKCPDCGRPLEIGQIVCPKCHRDEALLVRPPAFHTPGQATPYWARQALERRKPPGTGPAHAP